MTEFEEKVSKFKKDRQDPTPAQEMIYLGEVHHVCPLCGKKLIEMGVRKVNKNFEIASEYNSHNTERLDVEGMKKLLLKLDLFK